MAARARPAANTSRAACLPGALPHVPTEDETLILRACCAHACVPAARMRARCAHARVCCV